MCVHAFTILFDFVSAVDFQGEQMITPFDNNRMTIYLLKDKKQKYEKSFNIIFFFPEKELHDVQTARLLRVNLLLQVLNNMKYENNSGKSVSEILIWITHHIALPKHSTVAIFTEANCNVLQNVSQKRTSTALTTVLSDLNKFWFYCLQCFTSNFFCRNFN